MARKKIILLGCGGFVGSHLTDRLLARGDYEIEGWDVQTSKIEQHLDNPEPAHARVLRGRPHHLPGARAPHRGLRRRDLPGRGLQSVPVRLEPGVHDPLELHPRLQAGRAVREAPQVAGAHLHLRGLRPHPLQLHPRRRLCGSAPLRAARGRDAAGDGSDHQQPLELRGGEGPVRALHAGPQPGVGAALHDRAALQLVRPEDGLHPRPRRRGHPARAGVLHDGAPRPPADAARRRRSGLPHDHLHRRRGRRPGSDPREPDEVEEPDLQRREQGRRDQDVATSPS